MRYILHVSMTHAREAYDALPVLKRPEFLKHPQKGLIVTITITLSLLMLRREISIGWDA